MKPATQRHLKPIVSARDVVNRFGTQKVHDGISLDVLRGEVLGIAGGSGSGKSVLLKTLAGLHRKRAAVSCNRLLDGRLEPISITL